MQDIRRTRPTVSSRAATSVQLARQRARVQIRTDLYRRTTDGIYRPSRQAAAGAVPDIASGAGVASSSERQATIASARKNLVKYARKAEVLSRMALQVPPSIEGGPTPDRQAPPSKVRPKVAKQQFAASLAAIMVLLGAGYVSIDVFMTNREVKAAFIEPKAQQTSEEEVPQTEGQDETPLPGNALSSYAVAPDRPRVLHIDKIDVATRLLPMSVNRDGSMQAPINIYDAGWYEGSSKPGEVGAVVVDGHSSGPTRDGVFGKLTDLQIGDQLRIERGDGVSFVYQVTHMEQVAKDAVDMQRLMLPYGNSLQGLNLVTCVGEYLPAEKTFSERHITYAELVTP